MYKRYFVSYFRIIYQIFYGMTFMLCWYVMCLFILCGIILCFRQGSKVEQFHWLVIACINIFEIEIKKSLNHFFYLEESASTGNQSSVCNNIFAMCSFYLCGCICSWHDFCNFRQKSDNSLWPRGVTWREKSRSTLDKVMAWYLTAPSHHLNHCWLIIKKITWHSPNTNLRGKTKYIN